MDPAPTPTPTTPNQQNTQPSPIPQANNPPPQQTPPTIQPAVTEPPIVNTPSPTEAPPSTTGFNNPEGPHTDDEGTVKKSGIKIGIVIVIIIAVVAVIGGIIFLVLGSDVVDQINPADNFADARNATRQMDVRGISNAVSRYLAEWGNSVDDFGDVAQCSSGTSTIGTASGNIDLVSILIPEYTTMIPIDPTEGSESDTGYTICIATMGQVTISAPAAENGESISETR